ncbi:thioredoxin family protein [Parasphingopyxis sp.]|uniref:DUF1223 domain-containing protein n=1 Tax=Parasphingopyxis sp. TaxID=1920299 RepID=UPI002630BAA4|nr:DUF1223 domain-containing protein [Parasphingopyxis sp.]
MRTTIATAAAALSLAACAPMETHEERAEELEDVVLASAATERGPVAIELFTSQGCSSCPPADALVAELVDDPDLVVITRPVTYWDRLGWRDTLGREENTQLQRRYAQRLERGGGRSYTPQAVVDGRIGLVGSRRAELAEAVAEARADEQLLSIDITGDDRSGYRVTVAGTHSGDAVVRLLALDASETVSIGRGENGGRSVRYTNVVLAEQDIGAMNSETLSTIIASDNALLSQGDRHAIVVRDGAAGPILAAEYLGG